MRAKITTTIEEALLNKAKELAGQEGLSGANAIIERALELYFAGIQSEVWEKSLSRLNKAKELAGQEGLSGANAIIERALELYFAGIQSEVWEKSLSSGWIKKLVLKGDSILYENIKCRKTLENCRPEDYTQEILVSKGWKRV